MTVINDQGCGWLNALPKRNNIKQLSSDKKCDYLILNFPFDKNPIFNSRYNNGGILNFDGNYIEIGKATKTSFANQIIRHILK